MSDSAKVVFPAPGAVIELSNGRKVEIYEWPASMVVQFLKTIPEAYQNYQDLDPEAEAYGAMGELILDQLEDWGSKTLNWTVEEWRENVVSATDVVKMFNAIWDICLLPFLPEALGAFQRVLRMWNSLTPKASPRPSPTSSDTAIPSAK